MSRRAEFADAFGLLFRRAGIDVDLGSLRERDTEMVVPVGRWRGGWLKRVHDVVYEGIVYRLGDTDCVLMCLENQTNVAYDMPLRNLITSGLRWEICRERLEERNLADGKLSSNAEFLSGMCRGDRLPPVIVLALYLGKDPWDGPARLQDMVDTRIDGLRQFMADCPANVISLVDLQEEEVRGLKSYLRPLSRLLRTQEDDVEMLRQVREDPLFLDTPSVLYRTFNELTNANLPVPRQEEHNNMCLAIEKMKEKGRMEGREEGLEKGLAKGLAQGRKEGIYNLIETCRYLGVSVEIACQRLMACYSLTPRQAAAYLREYHV